MRKLNPVRAGIFAPTSAAHSQITASVVLSANASTQLDAVFSSLGSQPLSRSQSSVSAASTGKRKRSAATKELLEFRGVIEREAIYRSLEYSGGERYLIPRHTLNYRSLRWRDAHPVQRRTSHAASGTHSIHPHRFSKSSRRSNAGPEQVTALIFCPDMAA